MMTLSATKVLVTIQLVDDTNELLYFFLFVTSLFAIFARIGRFVAYVAGWIEDITEAVIFTAKVTAIAFKSLAYGLGVTV